MFLVARCLRNPTHPTIEPRHLVPNSRRGFPSDLSPPVCGRMAGHWNNDRVFRLSRRTDPLSARIAKPRRDASRRGFAFVGDCGVGRLFQWRLRTIAAAPKTRAEMTVPVRKKTRSKVHACAAPWPLRTSHVRPPRARTLSIRRCASDSPARQVQCEFNRYPSHQGQGNRSNVGSGSSRACMRISLRIRSQPHIALHPENYLPKSAHSKQKPRTGGRPGTHLVCPGTRIIRTIGSLLAAPAYTTFIPPATSPSSSGARCYSCRQRFRQPEVDLMALRRGRSRAC